MGSTPDCNSASEGSWPSPPTNNYHIVEYANWVNFLSLTPLYYSVKFQYNISTKTFWHISKKTCPENHFDWCSKCKHRIPKDLILYCKLHYG